MLWTVAIQEPRTDEIPVTMNRAPPHPAGRHRQRAPGQNQEKERALLSDIQRFLGDSQRVKQQPGRARRGCKAGRQSRAVQAIHDGPRVQIPK